MSVRKLHAVGGANWRRIAAACALCLLAAADSAAARVVTLVYASPYGPDHPFSLADRQWIRWVENVSHGTLRIYPVWSGALLSSDQSLIELRHGVADIGLITPIYVLGDTQMIRAQTAFYVGARTIDQQVAMYRCLSQSSPEFARELRGLKVLAVQGGTLPGIVTRAHPVRTLADLKDLRIRAPTELLGVLRDLGADPIDMPMDAVYSALAKGVLDGVVAPLDTFKSLHFADVAKYYTRIEIPRGAYPARAMGLAAWRRLDAADRAILEASTAVWERALARQIDAAAATGEAVGRHDGVKFLDISPSDQQRFNALYQRDARRSAASLARYGLDGIPLFDYAGRISEGLESTGRVSCNPVVGPDRRQTAPGS